VQPLLLVLVLVLVSAASAGWFFGDSSDDKAPVASLTNGNFDKLVKLGGKNAFVKFFAPWCGHCKKMAPAWRIVAKKFVNSSNVLIAEVDCTAGDGKSLCTRLGVRGFPSLKYWNAAAPETGHTYTGERKAAAMIAHAAKELDVPVCSVKNQDACSDDIKAMITEAKAQGGIDSRLAMAMGKLQKAKALRDDAVKAADKALERDTAELQPQINILQMLKAEPKAEL